MASKREDYRHNVHASIANLARNEDGTLPKYTSVGGYPIFYLLADSEVMCADCANGKNGSHAFVWDEAERTARRLTGEDEPTESDRQWEIVGADVNYESLLYCAHCNEQIESAYDPVD